VKTYAKIGRMFEVMEAWINSTICWWNSLSPVDKAWMASSWIMSAVALSGTFMNAERNKWGFVFWLVSNLYMTIRFFVIGEYAQSTLFFIYFILAIRGLFSWTKKENKEVDAQSA
jgi:nicotinamide riboside transporter PnuC